MCLEGRVVVLVCGDIAYNSGPCAFSIGPCLHPWVFILVPLWALITTLFEIHECHCKNNECHCFPTAVFVNDIESLSTKITPAHYKGTLISSQTSEIALYTFKKINMIWLIRRKIIDYGWAHLIRPRQSPHK